jgi:hypothetical protein
VTLKNPTQDESLEMMDDIEETIIGPAVNRAVRTVLTTLVDSAIAALRAAPSPESIVAAAEPWPLTAAQVAGWWEDEVSMEVRSAIEEAWRSAYVGRSTAPPSSIALDALVLFVTQVIDRLVHGLTPPLPDNAMDLVRVSIVSGTALGWSTNQVAEDIAARLDWDVPDRYWQRQHQEATEQLDALLDTYGPPGTPAREAARTGGDPTVTAWQNQRASARIELDRTESFWRMRATRIARTESTSAYNSGALAALADEGVTNKRWVATRDSRTRPTHIRADGQVRPLVEPFDVGGRSLQIPGDPSGPAREIINCRCTMIADDVD